MTIYVCDTGPLLCFAQLSEGPKLLRARYEGRIVVVKDVDADLFGLRRNFQPKVAKAATRAFGSAFQWIPRITIDDPQVFEEVLLVRDVIDTFRKSPKGSQRRPQEDLADAAAIVWATHHGDSVLMMNDTPARRAAKSRGVNSVSVVNILEAMVADGTITEQDRNRFLRSMRPELDPGE